MAIQNTLLIGNGINQVPHKSDPTIWPTWSRLLKNLAKKYSVPLTEIQSKPLPLVFEKIRLKLLQDGQDPTELLRDVAAATRNAGILSHHATILPCTSRNILTTNYGNNLCSIYAIDHFKKEKIYKHIKENYYSLFRGVKDKHRKVWNIHGEFANPKSILLGHSQYAKYMGQIKDYLYKGIKYSRVAEPIKSPLMGKKPNFNFEKTCPIYSWVDLFLKDEIHIIGLGLDFSEIIFWWLISEKFSLKARFPKRIGGINYYNIECPDTVDDIRKQCVRSMLEDLGVKIIPIKADSYDDGYYQIANMLKPNIVSAYQNDDEKYMRKLTW